MHSTLQRKRNKQDIEISVPEEDQMTSPNIYIDETNLYDFPENLYFNCEALRFAEEMKSVFPGLPKQFLYFNWLAAFGSMISHKIKINVALDINPRLYLLNIGKSGTGLKSESAKQTIKVFSEIEQFRYSNGAGSGQGLASYFAEAPNLLLFSDEFKRVVATAANPTNTLLPIVCTLADSNVYDNRLAKEVIRFENAHLSWITICPTDVIHNSWKTHFSDIGLDNRLFFVAGAGVRYGLPEVVEINPTISENIQDLYSWVVTPSEGEPMLMDGRRIISWQPAAKELHNEWDKRLPECKFNSRINTYAIRFETLYAIASKSYTITPNIVQSVIELMKWQMSIREYLNPVETRNPIAEIQAKVRRFFEGRKNRGKPAFEYESRLKDNFRNLIDTYGTEVYERALIAFEVAGDIKRSDRQVEWIGE
jgi:hypothetical protein